MKQFLLMAIVGFLAGCAPTLVPHTPYLPLLRAKGQAEARIATGFKGEELQLGYQVTNRLVLHASGLRYERADAGESFRSADIGLGWYWPLAADRWRLGLHGGMAWGKGTSDSSIGFCDGCNEERPSFKVGYSYAYLQPTVLFLGHSDAKWSAGAALRLGWANYRQLNEIRFDPLGNPASSIDHAGHQAVFLQPMVQQSYRPLPWLALSASTGFQFYSGPRNTFLNRVHPLVAQVGVHVILGARAAASN